MLWLGDNMADAYYAMDQYWHTQTLSNITEKLLKHFNKIGDIYPVLGNHEGLPRDHMKMEENAEHWPQDLCAKLWAPWFTEESRESFRKYGRYAQLHPGTKLRIVALNAFTKSAKNSYTWNNVTDVWGELKWLYEVLKASEKNGESVIIIGHYPPLNSYFLFDWNKRYLVLMERFSHIIKGQFFGHTHQDSFQLELNREGNIFGVALEHPSMTTKGQVYPAFRIYTMNSENYNLLDYDQYWFDLNGANMHNNLRWNLVYSFRKYYDRNSMNVDDFYQIAHKIRNDDDFFKRYAKMLWTNGPRSHNLMNNLDMKPTIFCKISCSEFGQYDKCIYQTGKSIWAARLEFIFDLLVAPPWEYMETVQN